MAKQRSEPTSDKRGAKVDEMRLTPLEPIDRIAALVPPPRTPQHRHFGMLAPHLPLRRPTAHTVELVHAAVMGMNAIYRPGISFAKAGVMLVDLKSEGLVQHELDLEPEPAARGHLMTALDELNDRFGRRTVQLASATVKKPRKGWEMKQSLLTPQFTTRWENMPVARA